MNFLKKKLKPLTSGLTTTNNNATGSQQQQQHSKRGQRTNRDLEEDLYDEYVVEAPPHPSELLALGVEPSVIDVNDPEKLRQLYKKAIEEGKDKKTNSILLARQRQKEELEEKKRTREEWKFFESLTTRVEQVVKNSQKNLDHWKETSAIDQLAEPDYELRQTADEVFKPVTTIKIEKDQDNWIDFGDDKQGAGAAKSSDAKPIDELCCAEDQRRESLGAGTNRSKNNTLVVKELLEDFGIDLRSEEQKRALERESERELREKEARVGVEANGRQIEASRAADHTSKPIDFKVAARPRPRPQAQVKAEPGKKTQEIAESDPFDTSFVAPVVADEFERGETEPDVAVASDFPDGRGAGSTTAQLKDPFDTSHVNL